MLLTWRFLARCLLFIGQPISLEYRSSFAFKSVCIWTHLQLVRRDLTREIEPNFELWNQNKAIGQSSEEWPVLKLGQGNTLSSWRRTWFRNGVEMEIRGRLRNRVQSLKLGKGNTMKFEQVKEAMICYSRWKHKYLWKFLKDKRWREFWLNVTEPLTMWKLRKQGLVRLGLM